MVWGVEEEEREDGDNGEEGREIHVQGHVIGLKFHPMCTTTLYIHSQHPPHTLLIPIVFYFTINTLTSKLF